jgi:hypothetical protein
MTVHWGWAFWLFCAGVFVGVLCGWIGEMRRAKGRLSKHDEHVLRDALTEWSEAYMAANPTRGSKYFKVREAKLFGECCRVGRMWIRTTHPLPREEKRRA